MVQRNDDLISVKVINVSSLILQGDYYSDMPFLYCSSNTELLLQTYCLFNFLEIITNIIHCVLGVYAPLTLEGNILVDDILASCYADISDHDLAHLGMIPMRIFSTVVGWIFGVDIGFSVFANIAIELGTFLSPKIYIFDIINLIKGV